MSRLSGFNFESAPWSPGALNTGVEFGQTIAVPGAQLGDVVICSLSVDLKDCQMTGYVRAADSVRIEISNLTGGQVSLGSGMIIRGKVIPMDVL